MVVELLSTLSCAKHFIHFTSFGICQCFIGVLKVSAQRVSVRGIVSNVDERTLDDISTFKDDASTTSYFRQCGRAGAKREAQSRWHGSDAVWLFAPHRHQRSVAIRFRARDEQLPVTAPVRDVHGLHRLPARHMRCWSRWRYTGHSLSHFGVNRGRAAPALYSICLHGAGASLPHALSSPEWPASLIVISGEVEDRFTESFRRHDGVGHPAFSLPMGHSRWPRRQLSRCARCQARRSLRYLARCWPGGGFRQQAMEVARPS